MKLKAGGLGSTEEVEAVSLERLKFMIHLKVSPLLSDATVITAEYVSVGYPAALRLTVCPDTSKQYHPL